MSSDYLCIFVQELRKVMMNHEITEKLGKIEDSYYYGIIRIFIQNQSFCQPNFTLCLYLKKYVLIYLFIQELNWF